MSYESNLDTDNMGPRTVNVPVGEAMTLLTPQDIAAMMQTDVRYIRPLLNSPGFPAPAVDLSRKIRRWTRESVEAWIYRQQQHNRPTIPQ